ncbi:MAG: putative RNase H-like HicB family nuclease [Candidatus Latescibacterota bacterium]
MSSYKEVEKMKYKIAIQQTEEGYSASCPGLPGCWSQGQTEEEVLTNIADAIKDYLVVAEDLAKENLADIREIEVAV